MLIGLHHYFTADMHVFTARGVAKEGKRGNAPLPFRLSSFWVGVQKRELKKEGERREKMGKGKRKEKKRKKGDTIFCPF